MKKVIIFTVAILMISPLAFADTMSCKIYSSTEGEDADGNIQYDKEINKVDVDMIKGSFEILWKVSQTTTDQKSLEMISQTIIRYSIAISDKAINFIVTDVSEAKEDPRNIKSLVNVILPLDQKKFSYVDHTAGLSFECSRK